MSEHNQHEEVIDQDISALTKISLLYDNSIAVKSLTLGVPWFGGAIDLILSKKGKEFVQRRSEIF